MGNDNGGERTDQQKQNSIQERVDSVGGWGERGRGGQRERERGGGGVGSSINFLLWA